MTKPTTLEDYVALHEVPARAHLEALLSLSRAAAPEATEAIRWGSPAFLHVRGTILFVVSAHAQHANFTVTPSTKEAFADELTGFHTGKGSVKLPYGTAIPTSLLQRMITHRIREFEVDHVLWM